MPSPKRRRLKKQLLREQEREEIVVELPVEVVISRSAIVSAEPEEEETPKTKSPKKKSWKNKLNLED